MRFWGLKSCDTCKKAQKALVAAGYDLAVTDVRADGVAAEDLARFHAAFGEALVNKRSTTWRGLSEEERAGDPLALLAAHPTLMKRPVVEEGDRLTLGWDKKTSAEWLENGA
ncbi:arsenate reductase [Aliiroseovarius crassostreae]|uniref:arsenate reductase family protein n=1 Tax=Aliiroseovarius crassostreae TaxID=154981 RepID=UPI002209E08D|nr:ArsC/Spx/MgsR family protein [Aliiroseovarius crassostreae]UWQ02594.1 arsenate reductase [Aliiroseovarius crassostreae]UWQ08872.1 arsenate reductase [Aliiroseovarius crassostreae]